MRTSILLTPRLYKVVLAGGLCGRLPIRSFGLVPVSRVGSEVGAPDPCDEMC